MSKKKEKIKECKHPDYLTKEFVKDYDPNNGWWKVLNFRARKCYRCGKDIWDLQLIHWCYFNYAKNPTQKN